MLLINDILSKITARKFAFHQNSCFSAKQQITIRQIILSKLDVEFSKASELINNNMSKTSKNKENEVQSTSIADEVKEFESKISSSDDRNSKNCRTNQPMDEKIHI
jgi:hypothetical protein